MGSLGPAYGAIVQDGVGADLAEDVMAPPPIPGLSAPGRRASYVAVLFPSTILHCARDSAWWLSAQPDGPGACRIVLGACVPESSAAEADFDARFAPYRRRWDTALEADVAIMERRQAGLAGGLAVEGESAGGTGGPFAPSEVLVHHFANWLLDRILTGSS